MRLGLAQMELKLGDVAYNVQKAKELLDDAKKERVDVLVFPEMANSGYYFDTYEEVKRYSEKIPAGPFSKELVKWSRTGGLVVAGISEHAEDGLYNSAVMIAGGEHLGTYRKHHLYGPEKKWFLKGPIEPQVIKYDGLIFSVIICFEWNYPERVRTAAAKGAKLILHPVNSSTYRWRDAMKTIAVDNSVFAASANRVGKEGDYTFSGESSIINPNGKIILKMNSHSHQVGWLDIEELDH
ncbi:MAG: nitrilase-related carbon-nitrogen hydrolase [Candidatus Thorarchaeota archaeon]